MLPAVLYLSPVLLSPVSVLLQQHHHSQQHINLQHINSQHHHSHNLQHIKLKHHNLQNCKLQVTACWIICCYIECSQMIFCFYFFNKKQINVIQATIHDIQTTKRNCINCIVIGKDNVSSATFLEFCFCMSKESPCGNFINHKMIRQCSH